VLPSLPLPLIAFAFDPIVNIGGISVRLETLGNAGAIFLALIAAVLVARRTVTIGARPPDAGEAEPDDSGRLRSDDLLYITLAAVPGAVIGGRIGYALNHRSYVDANPGALLDVGWGGLELALAVVGGLLTASIVAAMLGAPVGRWMHATILPLLFALGAGKLAMVLGGSGQGQPFDGGWATAYISPGPWGSLAPALPSHPSQAYEAIATWGVLLVVMAIMAFGGFRRRSGAAFLLGLGLWAVARALVATTWRDPAVLGDLRMDQVICVGIAAGSFGLLAVVSGVGAARGRRDAGTAPGAGAPPTSSDGLEWPDPADRPRI